MINWVPSSLAVWYGAVFLVIFFHMSLWALLALPKKRNDFVDVAWGGTFVLVTAFSFFFSEMVSYRKFAVFFAVAFWGIRLSAHLLGRLNSRSAEDWRYQKMRKSWPKDSLFHSFVRVFLLQGLIIFVMTIPIVYALGVRMTQNEWSTSGIVGMIIWGIGFLLESFADVQLAEFKAKPENRGQVIRSGLWKLSRHPNYFGEILVWWGIGIVLIEKPADLWMLMTPALITLLILFVSGVPPLEEELFKRKDELGDYLEKTPMLVPFVNWPQKPYMKSII